MWEFKFSPHTPYRVIIFSYIIIDSVFTVLYLRACYRIFTWHLCTCNDVASPRQRQLLLRLVCTSLVTSARRGWCRRLLLWKRMATFFPYLHALPSHLYTRTYRTSPWQRMLLPWIPSRPSAAVVRRRNRSSRVRAFRAAATRNDPSTACTTAPPPTANWFV